MIVGYAPGISPASWLQVGPTGSPTSNSANFTLTAAPTMGAGTYATTLRFVSGHVDGTGIVFQDVPVSLNLSSASLVISQPVISFTTKSGSDALPAVIDDLISTQRASPVEFKASNTWFGGATDWLSGIVSGNTPQTLHLQPNTTALPPGEYDLYATLTPETGKPRTLSVAYTVVAPKLVATPPLPNLTVGGSTRSADLSTSVTLSDDGAPLDWNVTAVSQSWRG